MDKLKSSGRDLSLRKSLVLYLTLFALLALFLSITTSFLCDRAAGAVYASYPPSGEKYYLTDEQGRQLGEGALISNTPTPLSRRDEHIIDFLELLPVITPPLYSALCIIAASLLFYKNKLKKPLALLRSASENIAENNLDFSVTYDSGDELGQLCASFELMRSTLADNFCAMWQQVEERRQLNAAFAHDLRTPLTVLKGYNEILQTDEHAPTRKTAITMGRHISRMETYINSMSSLRRLEDAQPNYQNISLQPFLSSLYESAQILCSRNGKTLHLQNKVLISRLSVDTEFIAQVCNNLMANAVRYASSSVTLSVISENNGLLLSVSDDGKGFNENSLQKAANPYFTEEADHFEHFGLGLYISRLLCEHHDGFLKLENTGSGAKVSAFFRSFVDKK